MSIDESKVREVVEAHVADLRATAITIREKLKLENTANEMEKAANELEMALHDPYAELKQAYADGKTIQSRIYSDTVWKLVYGQPSWKLPPSHYRIKPDEPEIPEGCPVIVWSEGGRDKAEKRIYSYYDDENPDYPHYVDSGENFWYAEIDYQRKGHVIPWCGKASCLPNEDVKVTAYLANGDTRTSIAAKLNWENYIGADMKQFNIIAYVIWPDWVKS